MTEIQDTSQPFHHDDTCHFRTLASSSVILRITTFTLTTGQKKMAEFMAEEVLEQKEGNPGSDPKFQRFAATVERALKGFELSREWQDLISCLTRLNKV